MTARRLVHLIGRKRMGQFCALLAAMFIGALLEMTGISLVAAACSLLVDESRLLENAIFAGFCRWIGIQSGKGLMIALLAALICLYLIKMLYLVAENRAIAVFICGLQHDLSVELYEDTLHSPYAHIVRTSAADVINLLNTDSGYAAAYLYALMQTTTEVLVLVTISGLLIAIDPIMTLFVLLGVAVSFLLTRCVIKPQAYRAGQARRTANTRRMKWIQQGVHGIKDVKVGQTEDFFCGRYEEEDGAVARADAANRLLTRIPSVCIEAIMVICVVLYMICLLLSGKDILTVLPALSALVTAALRLLPSCSRINANLTQMNNRKPSLEAVAAALERGEGRRSSQENAPRKEIRLEKEVTAQNITFSYEGRPEPVLRGATIGIPIGSSVGIVGASGAGKTTLVDLLLGLLEPQKGTICADGIDIRDCRESYLGHTAYIPQTIFLLDDTMRANVAFGAALETVQDEEIWSALERAALAEMVRKLPAGLDTLIGENGIRLSGGERQRLGIARALYQRCKLMIFDEATSALDTETEKAIIGSIQDLRGDKTLVIISHRASAVQDCDRVYRVENGRVEQIC